LIPDKNRVRVSAGSLLFELYAHIRPLGWFLPSQTAGAFFTIGGVISCPVNGGIKGADMVNRYVTALPVLEYDTDGARIRDVYDEDELRLWRSGFGLLGIILAVEFQVVRRESVNLSCTNTEIEWSKDIFNQYVSDALSKHQFSEFFIDFRKVKPRIYEIGGTASTPITTPPTSVDSETEYFVNAMAARYRDTENGGK
jgi:hypothetical protein